MTRPLAQTVAAVVLTAMPLLACSEPDVDVRIPERDGHVADLAGILQTEALEARLEQIAADGLDIVALTYTTPQANCGEAFRAGGQMVARWQADVALVAVARPGDFSATGEDRERCLGLRPIDDYSISRDLREEVVEALVPPLAVDNRWNEAFGAAADALARDLVDAEEGR